MKLYILADATRQVLVKQGHYSEEIRVPRLYASVRAAERWAASFCASVFTVSAPALMGCGYSTYAAVEQDAKALGLLCDRFSI